MTLVSKVATQGAFVIVPLVPALPFIIKKSILLAKSSILVGGQAVIEGVMMRVPGAYATAVRLKDNTIEIKRNSFTSLIDKHNMNNYYIIRGMIHLYESMKMGYQTLDWSASMNDDNYKKEKNITFYLLLFLFFLLISGARPKLMGSHNELLVFPYHGVFFLVLD